MTNTSFVATADLCDPHATATESALLRVLAAPYRDYGARRRFRGRVATVRCFEDNSMVRAAVESAGEGRVLVVDGGGSLRRALVGGNLAALAQRHGWAGIVVDGVVRDSTELAACDIGIRALGTNPMPSVKRNQGERDVPLCLQGTWVRPGEWLHADEDGIVVAADGAA